MPSHRHLSTAAMLVALAASCAPEGPREPPSDAESAEVAWDPADTLTDAELEAGRMDDSWREAVKLGRPPAPREFPLDTIVIPAEWLEMGRRRDADEVLRVQTLLDRAHFFPGVLD